MSNNYEKIKEHTETDQHFDPDPAGLFKEPERSSAMKRVLSTGKALFWTLATAVTILGVTGKLPAIVEHFKKAMEAPSQQAPLDSYRHVPPKPSPPPLPRIAAIDDLLSCKGCREARLDVLANDIGEGLVIRDAELSDLKYGSLAFLDGGKALLYTLRRDVALEHPIEERFRYSVAQAGATAGTFKPAIVALRIEPVRGAGGTSFPQVCGHTAVKREVEDVIEGYFQQTYNASLQVARGLFGQNVGNSPFADQFREITGLKFMEEVARNRAKFRAQGIRFLGDGPSAGRFSCAANMILEDSDGNVYRERGIPIEVPVNYHFERLIGEEGYYMSVVGLQTNEVIGKRTLRF